MDRSSYELLGEELKKEFDEKKKQIDDLIRWFQDSYSGYTGKAWVILIYISFAIAMMVFLFFFGEDQLNICALNDQTNGEYLKWVIIAIKVLFIYLALCIIKSLERLWKISMVDNWVDKLRKLSENIDEAYKDFLQHKEDFFDRIVNENQKIVPSVTTISGEIKRYREVADKYRISNRGALFWVVQICHFITTIVLTVSFSLFFFPSILEWGCQFEALGDEITEIVVKIVFWLGVIGSSIAVNYYSWCFSASLSGWDDNWLGYGYITLILTILADLLVIFLLLPIAIVILDLLVLLR